MMKQTQQKNNLKSKNVQQENNSSNKPIKINWIIDLQGQKHQDDQQKQNFEINQAQTMNNSDAKFGLCHCPGKKLAMGRDGKSHNRDLKTDLLQFQKEQGVSAIVCLLNEYELRSIGVDLKLYQQLCNQMGINFIHYPLIEMSVPECKEISEFDEGIIKVIENQLNQNKNVICHCRGGIGRAGLMASCLLLKFKIQQTSIAAIQQVRQMRDKRCVESRKQESFIQQYELYLKKTNI